MHSTPPFQAAPNSSAGCGRAAWVYHRGLFMSVTGKGLAWRPRLGPRAMKSYNRTMATMEPWHPCRRGLSPGACAAAWLASVTGVSLQTATRAVRGAE